MATPVPLAVNFARGRISIASGGSLVNFFAQSAPVGAKADIVLVGAPGAKDFATLRYSNDAGVETVEGKILAMAYSNKDDRLVVVGEHAVYMVSSAGTVTRLGSWVMQEPVSIATNGIDFIAVDGSRARAIWISAAGLDPVYPTATAFYAADSVTCLDGYLILNRSDTGQVFNSGIRSRTFSGLDFGEAEKSPDDAVGVLAAGDSLFIFGETTTEIWYNAANPVGSPFARVPGSTIEQGCATAAAAAQTDGIVFWLTAGGTVWMAQGMSPSRVSDDQVEAVLKERKADWASARAYCYTDEGHTFYVLTVGNLTLAYDLATGFWHQRANYSRGCAIGRCHAEAWGKHFVGADDGRILEQSLDLFEDAGEPLIAQVVSMPIHGQRAYVAIGSVQIEMDTGLSPLGAEYEVVMEVSGDGGKAWSTRRPMSIGKTGDYVRRVIWRKLGARRDWRFRFTISDPFRRAILAQMHLEM
ncbi:hypothetical protein [Amaricoccus solimangrovi]|uniref:Exo-alpha-sialidase n=1 Tax=Amaricoccus solimangrovi TaxID=2589815 RepID=A0A501WXV3_9RHOB|nr:hypothetical protein [Amaricoccus solimangrovi]TPE53075.1 hypothetical protein FJM51_03360 [Amaricoccus solimangrovi]